MPVVLYIKDVLFKEKNYDNEEVAIRSGCDAAAGDVGV